MVEIYQSLKRQREELLDMPECDGESCECETGYDEAETYECQHCKSITLEYEQREKLKAIISQVEKDARSESYTNGFREGFDAGVEKTNKRWSGKFDDIKADGVTRLECGCEVMKVTLCDKHAGFIPLSDLLENKKEEA